MRKIMIALTLLLGLGAPALAQDNCPPLQELLSIQMEWNPRANIWLLPMTVEGTPVKLMLDTGGIASQLSQAVVKQLGMREVDSEIGLINVDGQKSDKKVVAKDVVIGNARLTNVDFQVMPNMQIDADGIFTASTAYDIDLDFGAGKLNLFSPQHCEGKVVYWKAPAVAAVPINTGQNHIQLEVTLNGRTMNAIFDTGASNTILSQDYARRILGLGPDSPDMAKAGFANNDPNLPIYRHVFDSIAFEGVVVNHPRVGIAPDLSSKGEDKSLVIPGSLIDRYADHLKPPPLTIGMNVLKQLHIYLAFKEHKAYITAAETSAPAGDSDEAQLAAPAAKSDSPPAQ